MPVDPVTRAQFRLALYRIERDWYSVAEEMDEASDSKRLTKLRKMLKESILSSADIFAARRFFLSDEFSLVDCTIAPLLWRLPGLWRGPWATVRRPCGNTWTMYSRGVRSRKA